MSDISGGSNAFMQAANAMKVQHAKEAAAFVDFVLRHTWPERAARHGADTVHSIIANHPFAKQHGSKQAAAAEDL